MILLQRDMVIEPKPAALPLRMNLWLGRQRLQVGSVDLIEQVPLRSAELAQHTALIQISKALGDRRVELSQALKDAIAQTAQPSTILTQASTFALSLGLLGRAVSTAVP